MRYLVSAMLLVVGLIHLLPVSGALGGERLAALYGIPLTDANIAILMRHRAVLFGILGLFLVIAAFKQAFQIAAFVAGFLSVVSFLWLAGSAGGYNAQIGRVFAADLAALACLGVGVVGYVLANRVG